jgi:hypothetical protein
LQLRIPAGPPQDVPQSRPALKAYVIAPAAGKPAQIEGTCARAQDPHIHRVLAGRGPLL